MGDKEFILNQHQLISPIYSHYFVKGKIMELKARHSVLCKQEERVRNKNQELQREMEKLKKENKLYEKEKGVQAQYLDECFKKNQKLQKALTDREMKLRQAHNKLKRLQDQIGQNNAMNAQMQTMQHVQANLMNGYR